MKRTILLFIIFLVSFSFSKAYANIPNVVTFYFNASGPLEDSVFGFQFQYSLSDGSLLSDDDLVVHYTHKMTNHGPVSSDGAVPGIDFSIWNSPPSTEWEIGIQNNESSGGTNNIVGYTLGDEPLKSGILFELILPENVSLNILDVVLSDYIGTPGFFHRKFNFRHVDGSFHIDAVPLPTSALLLVAGLIGMATIKRKNNGE